MSTQTPFATSGLGVNRKEIYDAGGIKAVARNQMSRNLWAIMKEFKVLPTNSDFQKLTGEQIEFIIASMNYDAKLAERQAKGIDINTTMEDFDDSWWYESHEEFEPLREGHDEEDIARQVEERLTQAERKSLRDRFDSEKEYQEYIKNGGLDLENNSMREVIKKNIEKAREEAESGEFKNDDITTTEDMDNEEIQDVFKLFNEENIDEDDLYM